jgi:short-subunit dehydrogenase
MTTALVTGATAGIGREFARQLSVRKHDVVLVARDADRLDGLARDLERAYGTRPEALPADLVTEKGLAAVEARIGETERRVDIVVNNAGFTTFGQFSENDVDREEDEIRLNVLALVRLTHAALAVMEPRRAGAVVNISSLAAYQPSPTSATYSATKAFVNSFTQAIHEEARPRGVRVLLVCPGYTHTEFHERAGLGAPGAPEFFWQTPEQVVTAALRDLDRGRAVSFPGMLNRTLAAVSSVMPAGITRRAAAVVVKRSQ